MYIVAKGEWGGNIPGFLNTQVSTEHIRDTGSEKCSNRYIPCMDVNCQVSLHLPHCDELHDTQYIASQIIWFYDKIIREQVIFDTLS